MKTLPGSAIFWFLHVCVPSGISTLLIDIFLVFPFMFSSFSFTCSSIFLSSSSFNFFLSSSASLIAFSALKFMLWDIFFCSSLFKASTIAFLSFINSVKYSFNFLILLGDTFCCFIKCSMNSIFASSSGNSSGFNNFFSWINEINSASSLSLSRSALWAFFNALFFFIFNFSLNNLSLSFILFLTSSNFFDFISSSLIFISSLIFLVSLSNLFFFSLSCNTLFCSSSICDSISIVKWLISSSLLFCSSFISFISSTIFFSSSLIFCCSFNISFSSFSLISSSLFIFSNSFISIFNISSSCFLLKASLWALESITTTFLFDFKIWNKWIFSSWE